MSSAPAPALRIPFPRDDGSLTPYTFDLGYPLVTLVYDTLLWRDPQGTDRPWLAQSIKTSTDGMHVTLKLAPGARWQDGEPVTAGDVAFTFSYVASHFHPRFTPEVANVAGVAVIDPVTAAIALRHPSLGFDDQPLADLPILPAHLWQSLAPGQVAPEGLPIGSGPYRLRAHDPGRGYRFEADPTYFRGPPAVATIEVPIIDDVAATYTAFEQNRVDMIPFSLSSQTAAALVGAQVRLSKGESYVGTALVFNTRRAPFDRRDVRRAVSRALDLTVIARGVGDATPADRGAVHPGSVWAPPDPVHSVDLAGARTSLAALGLDNMDILVLSNDPIKTAAGQAVVQALRLANVAATMRPVSQQELARATGEDGSDATFTAAIASFSSLSSYDPDYLSRMFGSDPTLATANITGYVSPSFDSLAARVGTLNDPVARKVSLTETLRLLDDDAPMVPLVFATGTFAYRLTAYDRWVFIKGRGILDKRSFVDPAPRIVSPSMFKSASRASPSLPVLGLIGAAVVLLALVLAVVALRR